MGAQHNDEWGSLEKAAFRFAFIYFLLLAVPIDWKYYQQLAAIHWAHLTYGDIFILAHYLPMFAANAQSFATLLIIAPVALAGAVAWTYLSRNQPAQYNKLYYWIRAIVRYRLAIGVIAYGFIKVFPLQSPYPSISNLNTNYGDFTRWKLFSLSLGIVPSYETFLGLVEVTAGLLLLYRRTASAGALIVLLFTGNVFVSNLAYEGGEVVYSFYLILLALFVLFFDVQRIVHLLVLQQPTAPNRFRPAFSIPWQHYARLTLKTAFIFFFVLLYSFKTATGYKHDPYQIPAVKGVSGWAGLYNVSSFRINKDTLAYSKTDPIRWQDVVFEPWNTISIRSNRPVIIDSSNTERITAPGNNRNYELEGTAGRHYYSYQADSVHQVLVLTNKNSHYVNEQLTLHYNRPNDSTLMLYGINETRDSVFVTLQRINKKYLLKEVEKQGREKPLKL
jgi:hypothetical protein